LFGFFSSFVFIKTSDLFAFILDMINIFKVTYIALAEVHLRVHLDFFHLSIVVISLLNLVVSKTLAKYNERVEISVAKSIYQTFNFTSALTVFEFGLKNRNYLV